MTWPALHELRAAVEMHICIIIISFCLVFTHFFTREFVLHDTRVSPHTNTLDRCRENELELHIYQLVLSPAISLLFKRCYTLNRIVRDRNINSIVISIRFLFVFATLFDICVNLVRVEPKNLPDQTVVDMAGINYESLCMDGWQLY